MFEWVLNTPLGNTVSTLIVMNLKFQLEISEIRIESDLLVFKRFGKISRINRIFSTE